MCVCVCVCARAYIYIYIYISYMVVNVTWASNEKALNPGLQTVPCNLSI